MPLIRVSHLAPHLPGDEPCSVSIRSGSAAARPAPLNLAETGGIEGLVKASCTI